MSGLKSGITTLVSQNQQRTFRDTDDAIAELEHEAFGPVADLLWEHASYKAGEQAKNLRTLLEKAKAEAIEREVAAAGYEVASTLARANDDEHAAWHRKLESRLALSAQMKVKGAAEVAMHVRSILGRLGDGRSDARWATVTFLDWLRNAPGHAALGVPLKLVEEGERILQGAATTTSGQQHERIVHEVSAWELAPAFEELVEALELYQKARHYTALEIGRELPLFNLTSSRGGRGSGGSDNGSDDGSGGASGTGGTGFSGSGPRGM